LKDQAGLLILGVDPEDEQKLRGYDVDASTLGGGNIPGNPVDFLRLPGTVVISSELAEKERLKAGDSLPVFTSRGRIELKILYVLKDERVGSLYGGRIGIMTYMRRRMPSAVPGT
jgi:ABC-type lipoprotein release transport system permease subunit